MRVELKNIHKYYGAVRANNGIHTIVLPGTIHGLLGENGAGKSTLMKILSGFLLYTRGKILIDDQEVSFQSPRHASRYGIGMLYQDPLDYPSLTVLENFMLGQVFGLKQQKKKFRYKLRSLSSTLGFRLRPGALVRLLTVGERQQLEILRLLSLGSRLLILDEPTTGISNTQKQMLFDALRTLAAQGKSVLLVSHKLEDVESLCDRVTVLRQGKISGERETPFERSDLLGLMFGRPPTVPSRQNITLGNELLALKRVSATGGRTGLRNCSLSAKKGEVIGLAGLEGSGQDVLLRVVAGLRAYKAGRVIFKNENRRGKGYHDSLRKRIAFLPADRLEDGLIADLTIAEHHALRNKRNRFFVGWKNITRITEKKIREYQIKGSPLTPVNALSGGNQQRLLLSFLPGKPSLLLLENPTRGLDMASVTWVWKKLHGFCDKQTCIIFSSTEIDEILNVADRIIVFFDGEIVLDALTNTINMKDVGSAIAGG